MNILRRRGRDLPPGILHSFGMFFTAPRGFDEITVTVGLSPISHCLPYATYIGEHNPTIHHTTGVSVRISEYSQLNVSTPPPPPPRVVWMLVRFRCVQIFLQWALRYTPTSCFGATPSYYYTTTRRGHAFLLCRPRAWLRGSTPPYGPLRSGDRLPSSNSLRNTAKDKNRARATGFEKSPWAHRGCAAARCSTTSPTLISKAGSGSTP